jgi:hypothetical protein
MALINATLSGSLRISGSLGESAGRAFNALTPLTLGLGAYSVYVAQDLVIAAGVSEVRTSYAQLSNPQLIFCAANNELRINFAGQASSVSAASASVQKFKELFIMMDTSGTLPSGFSLGNSGSDSATCTVIIAG